MQSIETGKTDRESGACGAGGGHGSLGRAVQRAAVGGAVGAVGGCLGSSVGHQNVARDLGPASSAHGRTSLTGKEPLDPWNG